MYLNLHPYKCYRILNAKKGKDSVTSTYLEYTKSKRCMMRQAYNMFYEVEMFG